MHAQSRVFLCVLTTAVGLLTTNAKGTPPPVPLANGSSGKVDDAVRCVSLPRTKTEEPLNLYFARTKAKLPSAVLVLLLDKGQDAKTLLSSPGWQDFAEDYSLGLVAVAPATTPDSDTKITQPPTTQSQAAMVHQAVDREVGSLPLLLYSGSQQAAFAQTLLAANPKRVAAWCLRAPAHLTGVVNAAMPPGIVVCYKENKELYDALTEDYTRARKKGARLSWIALAGDKPTADSLLSLDSFVRKYMVAVLTSKPGMDGWENIDTKQSTSVADLSSHPERNSYLPHVSLASAWANLHVPGKPELAQLPIQEREENTFNPAQPKLHLYLRRPLSAEKTGGKIEGVLAFCTWKKEKESLISRLQNKDDFLVRYAEEHRLALLTWDTAQAWSTKESADQRSQQENFLDDQGFDKLANAWERGVHVLCHDAGLPENDFLLYGISRGAQWAHRLALRKPEHFLAVHVHINSSYDWPTPAAKNILWLQTTGEREYGYEAAKRFYGRCRELGYPILFKAGENLGHSDSARINKLGLLFFDYALGIRTKRDALTAGPLTPQDKRNASSLFALSGLAEAPFYADLINQEVFAAEEKEMVPEGQRVPLPTRTLAQAWGDLAEEPLVRPVSSPVVAAATINSSAAKPTNYFGHNTAAPAMATDVSAAAVAATGVPKKENFVDPAELPSSDKPSQMTSGEEFAGRYRLAIQKTVLQYPALAQAGSPLNEAFLRVYRHLKVSNDALLSDPSWPEQIGHLVKEQESAHPNFAREFRASIEHAVLVNPALAEADSPLNAAFVAEYQRLEAAGDPLLSDPTWPQQVVRKVSGKSNTP